MLKRIALVLVVAMPFLVGVETANASDRWAGPGWYAFECLFAGCFALGGPFAEDACVEQLPEDTETYSYVCADVPSEKQLDEVECDPVGCAEPSEQ